MASIKALGLNCTLKRGVEKSSTQKMLDQVLRALARHRVRTDSERLANLDIKPGVCTDEGDGDAWPALRKRILDANILVLGTPIWMGHPSSLAQRVLERMDAFLDEIDGRGRYPTFGRVAVIAVVGNEDGAHHVHAELMQGLADVGFTIPGGCHPYWVGEALGETNYVDLRRTPRPVSATIARIAANASHLARALADRPYPPA